MRNYAVAYGLLILATLALTGCASMANSIGAAALSVDTLATVAQRECDNPTPQDGCSPSSLLSTQDAREIRRHLQRAQDAVVDANETLNAGNAAGAGDKLGVARAMLASVESILKRRGVEYPTQ